MKNKTHIYMANLLIKDMEANKLILPKIGEYIPPAEVRNAIIKHPAAFRAGAVGPDFYPDLLLGQGVIHPSNSGKWIDLMFDRLRFSVLSERESNLAFTLGYMTHYAGDMFGHTYVNEYANGWFPEIGDIIKSREKAKIVARHMLVEAYMDQKVPKNLDMKLDPPIPFITDVFTCNKAKQLMSELRVNNALQNPLSQYIRIQNQVDGLLANTAIGMIPGVTAYVQKWDKDVEEGIKSWFVTWADISNKFASEDKEQISYAKKELTKWAINKLVSMIGAPDILAKVIQFIDDLNVLKPLKEYLENIFKAYLIAIVKAILGETYETLEEAIAALADIMRNPKTYLDSGILFDRRNVSKELDKDFGNYGSENDTTKQNFHAVSQCLNMSKLCLLGVDNLNGIAKKASSNVKFRATSYVQVDRIANIRVKTSKKFGAGTDNNVYLGVRYNGKIYENLCDKPLYNDFEAGDDDVYPFVIHENINLSQVDAITARMSGKTVGGDWKCNWIQIRNAKNEPLLEVNKDFKLETGKTSIRQDLTRYHNIPTSKINIDPKIISFLWSLDGQGKDKSNPAKQKQWELDCILYDDLELRKKVFIPLFVIK